MLQKIKEFLFETKNFTVLMNREAISDYPSYLNYNDDEMIHKLPNYVKELLSLTTMIGRRVSQDLL